MGKNTIEECALGCKKTHNCTHFAFGSDKNCNFKSGLVTKNDAIGKSGVQCGFFDKKS